MQGLGFAVLGALNRLTRTGPYARTPARRMVVMAVDPDTGHAGLYLDGELVHDFYTDDPFSGSLGIDNGWRDFALPDLLKRLDADFDTESRHVLSEKIQGHDYVEYDSYWPTRLEDAPMVHSIFFCDEDCGPEGHATLIQARTSEES